MWIPLNGHSLKAARNSREPHRLVKCSLELRECLDFLPRERFHTVEHPWRKAQESGGPSCSRRPQEKPPSHPPQCWRRLFHLRSSASCRVLGSRWSCTHNKPLGRVSCLPFHRWQVALGFPGPCPFQKHSACGGRGAEIFFIRIGRWRRGKSSGEARILPGDIQPVITCPVDDGLVLRTTLKPSVFGLEFSVPWVDWFLFTVSQGPILDIYLPLYFPNIMWQVFCQTGGEETRSGNNRRVEDEGETMGLRGLIKIAFFL